MKDELPIFGIAPDTGKQQEHTESQHFEKTEPTLGKKPRNTELILVCKILLRGLCIKPYKYPEIKVGRQNFTKTEGNWSSVLI